MFLCWTNFVIWAASWQNQQNDCAHSEDLDQPGHLPSLISVFAMCWMGSSGSNLSSNVHRRLWSDWADAKADLRLRWAHTHFVGFVMLWLICQSFKQYYTWLSSKEFQTVTTVWFLPSTHGRNTDMIILVTNQSTNRVDLWPCLHSLVGNLSGLF